MWHYAAFIFDPLRGQDFDDWRDELAEKGWRIWLVNGGRAGAWITVEGRRVWCMSLRRWGEG